MRQDTFRRPADPDRGERQSPAVLPHYLARFLYLLILPTLRGLGYAIFSDLEAWLRSAWLDLLIVALIVGLAVLRWRLTEYAVLRDGLRVRSGLLLQRTLFFSLERITAAEARQSWWLRLFRAEALTVRSYGSHVELYVSRRRARTLCELLGLSVRGTERLYRPDTAHLGLYALLTSDSLGGVLFAGLLLSRLGSLFGREVREEFVGALTQLVKLVVYGVPGAMLTAALWMLAAWGVSFGRTLIDHARTRLRRTLPENCAFDSGVPCGRLTIESGAVRRTRLTVQTASIAHMEYRQTMPGRLFGLATAYLGAPGLRKDDDRVLLLSAKSNRIRLTAARLLPECAPVRQTLRPGRRAWLLYLWKPLAALPVLIAAPLILGAIWPFWTPLLRFGCWMCCLPVGWLLTASWLGYRTAGIGCAKGRVTVSEPKRGYTREVTFPCAAARAVILRQSPFRKDVCSLTVRVGRERETAFRVRGVDRAQAERICSEILYAGG